MNRRWPVWLLALAAASAPLAAVTPAPIFTDEAVLQRDRAVPVWGQAAPGEAVTVSFAGQSKTTTADEDGQWSVRLDPLALNRVGADLTIGGASSSVVLRNVLVGDVWLCGGQSNMQVPMTPEYLLNCAAEVAAANYPLLRCYNVRGNHSPMPLQTNFRGDYAWRTATPANVPNWTCTGYFFGRELVRRTGVPIGLISSNYGGTPIESWTNPAGLHLVPELAAAAAVNDGYNPAAAAGRAAYNTFLDQLQDWLPRARASTAAGALPPTLPLPPGPYDDWTEPQTLWNAMIAPHVPYALRGAIWYQGEHNTPERQTYVYKMQALVAGWRLAWGQGDFPFYYMQLANYRTSDPRNAAGEANGWGPTREAQREALSIPNTGMAVAIDIGEADNIHPRDKQDAGRRLARWALRREYGVDLVPSGPLVREAIYESGRIRLTFNYAEHGLMAGYRDWRQPDGTTVETPGAPLQWFAVAGSDQVWYQANAVLDGQTVVVSSNEVPVPLGVRYAYANNPAGANLYNRDGLPAAAFDVTVSNPPTTLSVPETVQWTLGPGRLSSTDLGSLGAGSLLALGELALARLGHSFDYSLTGSGADARLTVTRRYAAGAGPSQDPAGPPASGGADVPAAAAATRLALSREHLVAPLDPQADRQAAQAALWLLADAGAAEAEMLPGSGPVAGALVDYLAQFDAVDPVPGTGTQLALVGAPTGSTLDLALAPADGAAVTLTALLSPLLGAGRCAARVWSETSLAATAGNARQRLGWQWIASRGTPATSTTAWLYDAAADQVLGRCAQAERRTLADASTQVVVTLSADRAPAADLTTTHDIRRSELTFPPTALAAVASAAPDNAVAQLAAAGRATWRLDPTPTALETETLAAVHAASSAGQITLRRYREQRNLVPLEAAATTSGGIWSGFRTTSVVGRSYPLVSATLRSAGGVLQTSHETAWQPTASGFSGADGLGRFYAQVLARGITLSSSLIANRIRSTLKRLTGTGQATLAATSGGLTLSAPLAPWLAVEPAGPTLRLWSWYPDLAHALPPVGRAGATVTFRPYTTRAVATTSQGRQAAATELTVIGLVHRVSVSTAAGANLATFPANSLTLNLPLTSDLLAGYGLGAADAPGVGLYRFDYPTRQWQPVPATVAGAPAALIATLTAPGDYAAAVAGHHERAVGVSLVPLSPLTGGVGTPLPLLSARLGNDAPYEPGSVRVRLDGRSVTPVSLTAEAGGTVVRAQAPAPLAVGRHLVTFAVRSVAGVATSLDVRFTVQAGGGTPPGAGLALVSLPFAPLHGDLRRALAADQARFANWTGSAYDLSDGASPLGPPAAGRGLWAQFALAPRISLVGTATEPTLPVGLALQAGWNLIGDPWAVPVDWDLERFTVSRAGVARPLQQAGDWLAPYAWAFRPAAGSPRGGRYDLVYDSQRLAGLASVLEPWQGYWVYALVDGLTLTLPPPSPATPRHLSAARAWSCQLLATQGSGESELALGAGADQALDALAPPAPPLAGPAPGLAVVGGRTGLGCSLAATTMLPVEWQLEVRPLPGSDSVRLSWPGLRSLPDSVGLTLVDLTSGAAVNLRARASYGWQPVAGEAARRFRLTAQRVSATPLRVLELHGGGARGRAVAFRYQLSAAARTTLLLRGANGRLLRTLEHDQAHPAGPQATSFDGRDSEGRPLPAGRYQLELVAVDEQGNSVRAVSGVRLD